ncbi:hypothetical protein LCGC14_2261440 [marine sediment metagenome]|uniref:Uncharacterized protein n=1 Tax=marine sediment metagenome TaxID=412755 RepID=A0A0F9FUM8_9ZZZZ
MFILKRTLGLKKIAYLKYDGWALFDDCALDLSGCIQFTRSETLLNPPAADQEWQYIGSYKKL